MVDRMFESIIKMYSEINAKMEMIDKKFDNKADKQDIILTENKMHNDTKALFDGYTQTFEKLITIEKKVDDISSKI